MLCRLLVLGALAALAAGARILAVLPTNSRSHHAVYERLLYSAARYHNLTVVTHFPKSKPPPNVEEISVAGSVPEMTDNLTMAELSGRWFAPDVRYILRDCVATCAALLELPQVRALQHRRFDLVVVEVFGSDCFLPLAHAMGAPTVGLVSSVSLPWLNQQLGNPDAPAYVPAYMMSYSQRMTLPQRLLNALATVWAQLAYHYLSTRPSQVLADRAFGAGPPLQKLATNYSLVLVNSHFSLNEVRPLVPTLVEVGGLHLDDTQVMPPELEAYMESHPEGVVYWSFGSMVRLESIPRATLAAMLRALAALPRAVLVRLDRALLPPGVLLPPNVHAVKWLPQYKTLCHRHSALFISHGGLLSTQEAVACGVPMLVVPLFADQRLNGAAVSARGVARVLNFDDIDEQSWGDTIRDLLFDPKYKQNAVKLSQVFLDRPLPPLETGLYWLDYVLRHGGAPHMRSPALDLSLPQQLLLDVLALLVLALALAFYVLRVLARLICRALCSRQTLRHSNVHANMHVQYNGHVHQNGHVHTNGTLIPNGTTIVNGHTRRNGFALNDVRETSVRSNGQMAPNGVNGNIHTSGMNDLVPFGDTNNHVHANGHGVHMNGHANGSATQTHDGSLNGKSGASRSLSSNGIKRDTFLSYIVKGYLRCVRGRVFVNGANGLANSAVRCKDKDKDD